MNSEEIFKLLIKDNNYCNNHTDELVSICNKHIDDNKNDSVAFNNLGYLYDTLCDYKKAEEYYVKSINLGNTNAMNNLGHVYLYVHKDINKAKELLQKAVDLGNACAMNTLGDIYYTEKNYTEAKELFTMSLVLGYNGALNNLGLLYKCVFKDYNKAEEFFIKAANLGSPTSIHNLGDLYKNVFKDYQKAYDQLIKLDKTYVHYSSAIKSLNYCKNKLMILDKIYGISSIDTDRCSICLDTLMKTKKSITILVCGHIYHSKCIGGLSKCTHCSYEIEIET